MTDDRTLGDRTAALEALLRKAGEAHSVYERDELDGVYDEDWPAWYARWAVDNGLADIMGRPIDAEELGRSFASAWDAARKQDPPPAVPWAAWMARRLASEG